MIPLFVAHLVSDPGLAWWYCKVVYGQYGTLLQGWSTAGLLVGHVRMLYGTWRQMKRVMMDFSWTWHRSEIRDEDEGDQSCADDTSKSVSQSVQWRWIRPVMLFALQC